MFSFKSVTIYSYAAHLKTLDTEKLNYGTEIPEIGYNEKHTNTLETHLCYMQYALMQ